MFRRRRFNASRISFGGSKSGNPWLRLMLPGVISLILVILRMTESVNVCTLLLNSGIGKTSLLMYFVIYDTAAS